MTTTRPSSAPAPGPVPAAGTGPRDRLLDAAADLFYREGTGTGIDALCRAAGVSKRSMYQLFASKDEVLAAALERRRPGLEAWLLPGPGEPAGARARILYVFERLAEAAHSAEYRGCPFLAVQVELKDPGHPGSVVAARSKERMADFFRAEAERGGAARPDVLARQLMVVYDGASVRAGVGAEHLDDGLATDTAAALLDAAGVTAQDSSRS
jgi:AcrR family transcriptional regulator